MNNKLGIYYGFLANSDDVDWADSLNRTKAAGLDILEMSASKLAAEPETKRKDLGMMARDLGIGLTYATGLPMDGDVSSDDPAVRAKGVKILTNQVKLIHQMGGLSLGGILTGVGKHFPEGIEYNRRKAVDNAIMALSEVAKAAEDYNVKIGVEVVNRFESPLLNTAEEALRVAETIDSPALGLLLDSFHMNIEEADLGAAIRKAGKHLVHFHACENDRSLPGHAHVNWDEIFAALHDIDYKGAIVMEALAGPYGTVAGRLNIWRRLAQDADKELKETVVFLKGKMAALN